MTSLPDTRTFYELQPLFPVSHLWQWGIVIGLFLFLIGSTIWLSLRDSRSLPRGVAWLFVFLRVLVLGGLVLFFLNPGQRSESRIVKPSRLAILIDTSLSMGLRDQPGQAGSPRRIDQIVAWLEQNTTIQSLRTEHEVSLYQFGESVEPEMIKQFDRIDTGADQESDQAFTSNESDRFKVNLRTSRRFAIVAFIVLGVALLLGGFWLIRTLVGSENALGSPWLVGAIVSGVIGLILLAMADLRSPHADLATSVGWKRESTETTPPLSSVPDRKAPDTPPTEKIDWSQALTPRGTSTQLGAALQLIINQERGGPIAGIIVMTDGCHNSGLPPRRAIASAVNTGIPIFPVGMGTIDVPKNVKVDDVQAPPRVFPGDKFQVKGLIKAYGLSGTTIAVQLVSIDEKGEEAETIEDETTVRLADDGEGVPVTFNTDRLEQEKRRYIIRVASVPGDLEPRDNERSALVEIVDRETKVLLMAGGPMREYRFLRNQLYRDKDIDLSVWLQSAKPGADQESDTLLDDFPTSREALYEFDCIVAFDPDWRLLSKEQATWLERWVAEQAGGLIVIAGPVSTPEWTRRPRGDETIDQLRRLYPVAFYNQGTAQLRLGRFGGSEPFPLDFTREGRAAEFLWLGDSATESQDHWGEFEGVYGYYSVNEAKAGADVLAYFADPTTAVDDRLPIYLASQYYGAGRVFFQASGEMWRIRRLDVEFFQQYYVKLIRWASQGRLLRDSTRGVLLVDRERCWMGDQVTVQAMLRDVQDQPLAQPHVDAMLHRPDGTSVPIRLNPVKDGVRPGMYGGQFAATEEGEYRLSLPIPNSNDFEVLTASVQSNIPDLEKEKPQRNDRLLSAMAEKTQGHYYVGIAPLSAPASDPLSPVQLMPRQDQVTFLTGTLDFAFQRKLAIWLLILLTTLLSLEWTVRRLNKLA